MYEIVENKSYLCWNLLNYLSLSFVFEDSRIITIGRWAKEGGMNG